MNVSQNLNQKGNLPSLSQVKIEIFGPDVIGVNFRTWAQKGAIAEGIKGYVRNTANGTVEIIAEGEKDNLERFINACNTGPEGANVEKVDVEYGSATGEFKSFEIR
jgi:acylphosphatase